MRNCFVCIGVAEDQTYLASSTSLMCRIKKKSNVSLLTVGRKSNSQQIWPRHQYAIFMERRDPFRTKRTPEFQ
jgi:hypothetical protein